MKVVQQVDFVALAGEVVVLKWTLRRKLFEMRMREITEISIAKPLLLLFPENVSQC